MSIIKLGFAGAHRTGKTSLANVLSQELHLPFLKTDTQRVFKQWGLDPAGTMNFRTRLSIQHHILHAAIEVWRPASGGFVTDRTPIDFMAYTLAELQGNTEVEFAELEMYVEQCFQVVRKFFTHIGVIQPAIPIKYEVGKAAMNRAYMEHLNVLVEGLCGDERMQCKSFILPRKTIDLHERVKIILAQIREE